MNNKITKEQLKEIIETQAEDIRILSWNMKLSFLDSPWIIQTISSKKTQIIIVWQYLNDWEDFNVSKKAMALTLSNKMWLWFSKFDIEDLFNNK